MDKITLYVVTHKDMEAVIPERTYIGVGNNKKINKVSLYDDTGDNIAEKNANYCELTALYWMWKNDKSDIVGLEHYRRQFVKGNNLLDTETILSYLNNYDVIVPRAISFPYSAYQHYSEYHFEEDLLCVRKIIKNMYPEYLVDFDFLKETNKLHMFNMVISRKSILDDYFQWLFDILFCLEQEIDITKRDDYQKRVFGFLSERLFNVYLHHNYKLKLKEVRVNDKLWSPKTFVQYLKWDVLFYLRRLFSVFSKY